MKASRGGGESARIMKSKQIKVSKDKEEELSNNRRQRSVRKQELRMRIRGTGKNEHATVPRQRPCASKNGGSSYPPLLSRV